MTRRRGILLAIASTLAIAIALGAFALSYEAPCTAADPLSAGTPRMNAVTSRCYGSPDILRYEAVPKPTPADDQLLVEVHAASINPADYHYMRGKPYVMRLFTGLGTPNDARVGSDFAGTIEAVGRNVTRFKAGDEVFGGRNGALAEYVVLREDQAVVPKPENLSFEQAATFPIAAITALQALRDKGRLQAGQKVLINGASGGVGTFAVQIGKALGAEVTGVCSTRNVDLVRSLGADHVVDYTKEGFTRGKERYDLIVDNVGNHALSDSIRVLKPGGILVIVGGPKDGRWIGPVGYSLRAAMMDPFVDAELATFVAELNQKDLGVLRELASDGKLTPVIDRQYPLGEAAEAMRYLETGRARGKVVLGVDP